MTALAFAVAYAVPLLTPVLLAAIVLPPLVEQATELTRDVPGYVERAQDQKSVRTPRSGRRSPRRSRCWPAWAH